MALFGSLGLFLYVWSLGPNLDLLGPKSPKYAGGPKLFIGPLDFTYPSVFKIALVFVGGFRLIFGLGQNLNRDL